MHPYGRDPFDPLRLHILNDPIAYASSSVSWKRCLRWSRHFVTLFVILYQRRLHILYSHLLCSHLWCLTIGNLHKILADIRRADASIHHFGRRTSVAVQLLIRDGNPYWYLSPDIWVVPGTDPSGSPGSPIAGQTAYLWARVANTGSTDANGVRVDFYWANPALQVTRSNATLIGSAYADVPAGGAQDALCLVPWTPVIVNDGHECLVAVANHPGDPLPSPLPDAFDPPTYAQVAQKNLTVLVVGMHALMLTITVSGRERTDKSVTLTSELGGELDAGTLASVGLRGFRPAKEHAVEVGLDQVRRNVGDKDPIGKGEITLAVSRRTSAALYVTIRSKNLAENEYQLVQIVERAKDKVLGGLGLLVVSEKTERKEKKS
jgi:hypothetical protein